MISLEELIKLRKIKGLTWTDLAEGLPVTGEALRVAVSRGKIQPEYYPIIEGNLNLNIEHIEQEVKKETPNDRFEDLVAAKVMAQIDIKLEGVRGYHKTVINELAKNATRVQRILTRLEILEENLIQETRKLKDHFK